MTEISMSTMAQYDACRSVGSGRAASDPARWLGLAAAPTFAFMALWSAFFGGQSDLLCLTMQDSSPISGMTFMYLLMSASHAAPWLGLISGRQSGCLSSGSQDATR